MRQDLFEKEKIDKNPNRPKKGDVIRTEPIRKPEDLQAIKELLKDEPRNLAVFTFGVNTALRASDILRTRLCDVQSATDWNRVLYETV